MGQGDGQYEQISIILHYNVSVSILSDHFIVQCNKSKNELSSVSQASSFEVPYISIRYDRKIRRRLATVTKQKDDFNILILGLDSVSRLQFERMLPKTFAYITKKLNGTVLKGQCI